MKKSLIILGSTGSIGSETLSVIKKKDFNVKLITTNRNTKKLLKQAIFYKVKNAIVEDKAQYIKNKNLFKKNNIKLFLGLKSINKIIKNKINYCINSISGINGLEPTLDIIPFVDKILIANKESIICGWELIEKKLRKYNTKFIPLDSEHFSIWSLIKDYKIDIIQNVVLTASGGPFLNVSKKKINNIKPQKALSHPNWKMGKKISIDSSNMMNKIFEYIEAIKIFKLKKENLSILIHPTSFVHAIIFFKGGLIKFLAHDTKMSIPISNALNIITNTNKKIVTKKLYDFNKLKFLLPDKKKFPLLSIIPLIPNKPTYFETILVTLNDLLVEKYLSNEINYVSIHKNLLSLIKTPYFTKYYKLKPKNIYDIKNIIKISKNYLNKNLVIYEN